MSANYLAVGDEGSILCSGDDCSGEQQSGTSKHLLGVARAGIDRVSGVPLALACGDDGVCLRLGLNGDWETRSTQTGRDLNAVSFAPGTRTAWVVGDEGTILKTTDGGGVFGVQTSKTSKHLYSVWAVSERLVYACGDGASVFRSEDGGTKWEQIHHGNPFLGAGAATTGFNLGSGEGVHAVGEKVMVVASSGWVLLSGNRGNSWKAEKLGNWQLRACWLGDDGFAIAVGRNGKLFTNPPGRGGWTERNSGTTRDLNGVIRYGDTVLVVGDEGESLKSKALGSSWEKTHRGSRHLNAIA